jgi:hypothetical protein
VVGGTSSYHFSSGTDGLGVFNFNFPYLFLMLMFHSNSLPSFFDRFHEELTRQDFAPKGGCMQDGTFVEVPKQPNILKPF